MRLLHLTRALLFPALALCASTVSARNDPVLTATNWTPDNHAEVLMAKLAQAVVAAWAPGN